MDETRRPLNECAACGYTWYPRGKNISATCPRCHGAKVELAPPPPPVILSPETEAFLAELRREEAAADRPNYWPILGGVLALCAVVSLAYVFWDVIAGILALLFIGTLLSLFRGGRRRRRW